MSDETWEDLADTLDEEYLSLPVNGKIYRIYDVDGDTALRVKRLMKVAEKAKAALDAGEDLDLSEVQLDDADEEDLYAKLLGEAGDQLRADGVKSQRIEFMAQTAMVWIVAGKDAARAFWGSGGSPEAAGPGNRASRRASAAAARTTQKRASGSGTRARKTSGGKGRPGTKS